MVTPAFERLAGGSGGLFGGSGGNARLVVSALVGAYQYQRPLLKLPQAALSRLKLIEAGAEADVLTVTALC